MMRPSSSNPPSDPGRPELLAGAFLLLSSLRGQAVRGCGERLLGHCVDVVVRLRGSDEALVTGLVIADGQDHKRVLAICDAGELHPRLSSRWATPRDLAPLELGPGELLAHDSLIGARAVDTRGPALLRVADLVLLPIAYGRITVAGIIPRPGHPIARHLHLPWRDRSPAQSLDWPSTVLLIEQPVAAANRTAGQSLARLHPAQIADLIEVASRTEGEQIIRMISDRS